MLWAQGSQIQNPVAPANNKPTLLQVFPPIPIERLELFGGSLLFRLILVKFGSPNRNRPEKMCDRTDKIAQPSPL
jgi:hypothetical protein